MAPTTTAAITDSDDLGAAESAFVARAADVVPGHPDDPDDLADDAVHSCNGIDEGLPRERLVDTAVQRFRTGSYPVTAEQAGQLLAAAVETVCRRKPRRTPRRPVRPDHFDPDEPAGARNVHGACSPCAPPASVEPVASSPSSHQEALRHRTRQRTSGPAGGPPSGQSRRMGSTPCRHRAPQRLERTLKTELA
ncbi:DUF732 domain-containing protein [Pseudonocardia alni]